jgi:hypothetical protein
MKYFKYPGNKSLRTLVALHVDDYLTCTRKGDKTRVIRAVIHNVLLEYGGRFLKIDPISKGWYDGGLKAAKIRVGVAFRDAKAANKVRYVQDMQNFSLMSNNCSCNHDEKSDVYPQKKTTLQGLACPSSSLLDLARSQLTVSSDSICQQNAPSTDAAAAAAANASTSTIDQQVLKPCPIESDDADAALDTANQLLEGLVSTFDDVEGSTSFFSEEQDTNVGSSLLLEEVEPLTVSEEEQNSREQLLSDFILSNDLYIDDFIQTLSHAYVGH